MTSYHSLCAIAQIADEKVKQRSLVDNNALCIQNILFEGSFFGRRKMRLLRWLMNAMLQGSLHCISEALVRPSEENWRIAVSLRDVDDGWVMGQREGRSLSHNPFYSRSSYQRCEQA